MGVISLIIQILKQEIDVQSDFRRSKAYTEKRDRR